MRPKVSILLPHFQTPNLTLLCLRLLRHRTKGVDHEIIVIDNGSEDGSGRLLDQVPGVRVLRRELEPAERPALAHGRALNVGLRNARADLIAVMHTDTMVLRDDWLGFLVECLDSNGSSFDAVGSWKMETPTPWRRWLKSIESRARHWLREPPPVKRYLRSHCAMYRREAIECRPLMFEPSPDCSAGEELHREMETLGKRPLFLPPELLGRYIRHLNHATMALNEGLGRNDRYMPRTRARAVRRIEAFLANEAM